MATPLQTATITLPPHAPAPLLVLILLCDTPIPSVAATHGSTYGDIFTTLFRKSVELAGLEQKGSERSTTKRQDLRIESYHVVKGEYPSTERVQEADAILLTGSASNAYDPLPWITDLVNFVASLPTLKPTLKVFGICFGHQIVARAFGGEVGKNAAGWEIGVRTVSLTAVGKQIFSGSETISIHQMHQDHVPSLPAGFELVGSTPVSPIQGMVKLVPTASSESFDLKDVSIITLQGHPEFSPEILYKIIDTREERGIISHELANKSREYAAEHDEGVRIGRVLLAMLGV